MNYNDLTCKQTDDLTMRSHINYVVHLSVEKCLLNVSVSFQLKVNKSSQGIKYQMHLI